MTLERRIEALEKEVAQDQVLHPPGARTVRLPPIPRFSKWDSFDVERLIPLPQRKPTLDKSGYVQFVPPTAEEMAELDARETLRETLKGLDRDTQRKLAAEHGYRVIYPDEDRSP